MRTRFGLQSPMIRMCVESECRDEWKWRDDTKVDWQNWKEDKEPQEGQNVAKTSPCDLSDETLSMKWIGANSTDKNDAARVGAICIRNQTHASSNTDINKALLPSNLTAGDESDNSTDSSADVTDDDETESDPVVCSKVNDEDDTLELFHESDLEGMSETEREDFLNICNGKVTPDIGTDDDMDPDENMCANDLQQSPDCVCPKGYYGDNCDKKCGHCDSVQCKKADGDCMGDCDPGYQGINCQEECPAGWFGPLCALQCGSCKDESACDPVSGNCTECKNDNYQLALCLNCSSSFYGDDCEKECGDCLGDPNICDRYTGHCEQCEAGKDFPFCKCNIGFYNSPRL